MLGRDFNLQDTLVRNNIALRGFIAPSEKTGSGYRSDHNLADAGTGLFVDPATGDFRLRADATAAIDTGSTDVPHLGDTEGAPDLGALERGADDWIDTDDADPPAPQRSGGTGTQRRHRAAHLGRPDRRHASA
ncbi:MAG: hypothetical protein ACOCXJ_01690 [Planctomycetota bacterium]